MFVCRLVFLDCSLMSSNAICFCSGIISVMHKEICSLVILTVSVEIQLKTIIVIFFFVSLEMVTWIWKLVSCFQGNLLPSGVTLWCWIFGDIVHIFWSIIACRPWVFLSMSPMAICTNLNSLHSHLAFSSLLVNPVFNMINCNYNGKIWIHEHNMWNWIWQLVNVLVQNKKIVN